jgi:transposase, IS5 family
LTRQILNDSERVLQEVEALPGQRRRGVRGLGERLGAMAEQVRRVVRQTKARVFSGLTQFPDKLVSLFEPHTEVIRKGKAGQPNEFGKLVELQEAENQIITHYEVYEERPSDRHLLLPAVEAHRRKLGRVPGWVAADAGFYSQANEQGAQALGVKYVSIPNRNTRSPERRRWEKQRWFKKGQKWRTGCEGRISVLKRRHGLSRCRYHGLPGMRRWVGLGVIADNLINLGRHLAPQPA